MGTALCFNARYGGIYKQIMTIEFTPFRVFTVV